MKNIIIITSLVFAMFAPLASYAQNGDSAVTTTRRYYNSQNPLSFYDIKTRIKPELLKMPSVRGVDEDAAQQNLITIVAVGNIDVNLDGLRNRLNTNGTNREEEFAKFYKAILTNIQKTDPFKPENLRLVIRPKAALDEFETLTAVDGVPNVIIRRNLIGNLQVVIVADTKTSIAMMPKGRLQDLKVTEDEAFEKAYKNLEDFAKNIKVTEENGIYFAELGEGYDSSVLLLDDIQKSLVKNLGGEIAVAIPTRDKFVFVNANNPEQIEKLKIFIKELPQSNYSISKDIFVKTDGKWQILQ